MTVKAYQILVCPVCGEQPLHSDPDMFGEINCDTHGATEPLEVVVVAMSRTTAPARHEKLPTSQMHWVISKGGSIEEEFNPLGGAARGVGRCTCPAGPGTNPACQVHP